jgi:hypothetical protein
MKITTQEIRRALELLLEDFEVHGATEWEFDEEYYWDVPSDQRYDNYNQPTQLTTGQLTEDMERVRLIARRENAPVPLGLVWLSNVLRLAGEKGPYDITTKNAEP